MSQDFAAQDTNTLKLCFLPSFGAKNMIGNSAPPRTCCPASVQAVCHNTVLCGLCGPERSEAGCRGNKLQLLSILRDETRTAKETVIRSLAKCSTKQLQSCRHSRSSLSCICTVHMHLQDKNIHSASVNTCC